MRDRNDQKWRKFTSEGRQNKSVVWPSEENTEVYLILFKGRKNFPYFF